MRFLSLISLCLSLVLSSSAMTPMQRLVLLGQPSLNSTAQGIVNTLKQQGTPPDATLTRWVADAVKAVNSPCYAALYQPASSTVIGFGLKGTGLCRVNWGDGTSTNITLNATEQKLVHNYATAAKRPVLIVGNVTYFRNDVDASYGGALSANYGGRIDSLTSLTFLYVAGNNTLSGSVAGLTSLTVISVQGNNTLSGSVAGLTSLTFLSVGGNNTLSGSVAGLTGLTYFAALGNNTLSGSVAGLTSLTLLSVYGNNTLSGSVAGLTSLTFLSVGGNNTLSGSVAGLTSLTTLNVGGNNTLSGSVAGLTSLTTLNVYGNNTLSGSVAGLTSLTFLYVTGNNTVIDWELLAASNGKLSQFIHGGLTVLSQSQVDAILAGFWANRDVAKPRATERTISIANNGSSAPSAAGLTTKASLAGYKSPNNTGPMYWTVTTP